ncbi:hypothetical protein pdam_00011088 [Pocillopora damicornis]|uniref:Uncharacterized protein n=1 Tax=Pocillopora damicornis TaxID=46731 RepID=A0A3M6U3W6_POCDA|nr:hypothetical protein pdam_00011088 [Pocillopora damicornis]
MIYIIRQVQQRVLCSFHREVWRTIIGDLSPFVIGTIYLSFFFQEFNPFKKFGYSDPHYFQRVKTLARKGSDDLQQSATYIKTN